PSDEQQLALLERLVALRQRFADRTADADPHRRSQLRLADIGLEDYAFALTTECVNRLGDPGRPGAPPAYPPAPAAALDNVGLGVAEPEESAALRSEVAAWAAGFAAEDRFHLLRLRATIARARRVAEGYADRVGGLFGPLVGELGRELGVAEHAVRVF